MFVCFCVLSIAPVEVAVAVAVSHSPLIYTVGDNGFFGSTASAVLYSTADEGMDWMQ